MSIIKNDFEKMNITKIKNSKNNKKLTVITAYDALFAKLFEEIADMILVGDSLNMSFAGREDTLSATLEQMIYHTNAVCTGAPKSFVVLDMPFGTYINKDEALSILKNYVEYKSENKISVVEEEALQQLLFEVENVPFPNPENYTFKFIDLFAGIGGFRIGHEEPGDKTARNCSTNRKIHCNDQANYEIAAR